MVEANLRWCKFLLIPYIIDAVVPPRVNVCDKVPCFQSSPPSGTGGLKAVHGEAADLEEGVQPGVQSKV